MSRFRKKLKRMLPRPIRVVLRALLHYTQRLARWGIILVQMRGASVLDEFKLILSACATPVVSLKHLMEWQDPVLLFDTEVVVHGVGRFHLRRHSDDLWHVLPWREQAVVKALRGRLQEGNIFSRCGR